MPESPMNEATSANSATNALCGVRLRIGARARTPERLRHNVLRLELMITVFLLQAFFVPPPAVVPLFLPDPPWPDVAGPRSREVSEPDHPSLLRADFRFARAVPYRREC